MYTYPHRRIDDGRHNDDDVMEFRQAHGDAPPVVLLTRWYNYPEVTVAGLRVTNTVQLHEGIRSQPSQSTRYPEGFLRLRSGRGVGQGRVGMWSR